jgi:hypothetical protein
MYERQRQTQSSELGDEWEIVKVKKHNVLQKIMLWRDYGFFVRNKRSGLTLKFNEYLFADDTLDDVRQRIRWDIEHWLTEHAKLHQKIAVGSLEGLVVNIPLSKVLKGD